MPADDLAIGVDDVTGGGAQLAREPAAGVAVGDETDVVAVRLPGHREAALARLLASPIDKKQAKGTTTVSVLVLAPTRELAIQTHETLDALGAPLGIASVAVFGGVDKGPQIRALKNAHAGAGAGTRAGEA